MVIMFGLATLLSVLVGACNRILGPHTGYPTVYVDVVMIVSHMLAEHKMHYNSI